jgi:hypothetical protein
MDSTLIKLTDRNGRTRGNTQWGYYVTHAARESDARYLFSDTVIHAYRSMPLGLLLHNGESIFGSSEEPLQAWEAEGEIVVARYPLCAGCANLTTTRELVLPQWYMDKSQLRLVYHEFFLLCAAQALRVWEFTVPGDTVGRIALARMTTLQSTWLWSRNAGIGPGLRRRFKTALHNGFWNGADTGGGLAGEAICQAWDGAYKANTPRIPDLVGCNTDVVRALAKYAWSVCELLARACPQLWVTHPDDTPGLDRLAHEAVERATAA